MIGPYQKWLMSKIAGRCVVQLKKHGFDSHLVEDRQSACDLILPMISEYESFGFGGSDTTRSLGLYELLKAKGKIVFDHLQSDLSPEASVRTRYQQLSCDCFLCSANAISATGEIVNVDGVGNRTSAMAFGPRKVFVIAGVNKVTADLDSAIRRIRDVAAPMRAKSLGVDTPCAETGFCNDCDSPKRICNITTILHRKPLLTDISVILINESLGF